MVHYLSLKNCDQQAIIDLQVFQELSRNPHLAELDFFNNLRQHSSGCVVFQKTHRKPLPSLGYRTETIYLHKLVAELYLADNRVGKATLVGCVNGNKRDCRLENLEYRTRSVSSRKRKTCSKAGYTGVYEENNRYRAVISRNGKSMHIGMFATPEEAARAYNVKSIKLFGKDGKLNVIRPHSPLASECSGGSDRASVLYAGAEPEGKSQSTS